MLAVLQIKSPVIVNWTINSILTRSAIMPCSFQFAFLLPLNFFFLSPKGLQRSCLNALSPLQIVPSTIWRNAISLGNGCRPYPTNGLRPLTPARCCHPLHSWHKGLPALCTPSRQNVTPAAVPSAGSPFRLFFKNPLHRIL